MDMVGQFATSKAGHDKDTLYVIMGQEGDFVFLCDGDLRPPDKLKKKRKKHIRPIKRSVEGALLEKLQRGEKVFAEEIRYALKMYKLARVGCNND